MKRALKYLKGLFSRNKEVKTHIFFIPEDSFYRVIQRAFDKADFTVIKYKNSSEQEYFVVEIDRMKFEMQYFKEESPISEKVSCSYYDRYVPSAFSYLIESLLIRQMKLDNLEKEQGIQNFPKEKPPAMRSTKLAL